MRTTLLPIIACLFFADTHPVRAQHWSQFRGSRGDGLATGRHPEAWSANEHVAWKTRIPGVGWSQPIVWGDKVFLTTAISDNQPRPDPNDMSPGDGLGGLSLILGSKRKPPDLEYRWTVLCLDLATGNILWERVARAGKPSIPVHPNNSYATETPVTDGEHVIAYFGPAGIHCFDLSGDLLWSKDLGSYRMQMDWGMASSPVLHGECVFVQCDNEEQSFLVALDKSTGEERWRANRDEKSNWSTPHIWRNQQRVELVAAGGNRTQSYDPLSGRLLWELTGSGRCSPSPVSDETLLYVYSADRLTGQRGVLTAIRPGADGDISLKGNDSTNDFVAWSTRHTGGGVASPLRIDNYLYLLEQHSGIIRCLDARNGKQIYRQRIPGAVGITASPWSSGGNVFCVDQSGGTFMLAVGPELKVLATNKLDDDMFWSSPAVIGDSLLLRGLNHLFCIR